jgi:hypothetical protein
MKISALLTTVLLVISASAAESAEVTVQLSPAQQIVKRGNTPRFVVTVTATTSTLRVMKFAAREDLRDNYARLFVTHNGAPIDVPRLISDPGPTSESDYLELPPGKELTFTHNGSPFALSKLPPGDYVAVVKLQPDWSVEAVESNAVSFQVSGNDS